MALYHVGEALAMCRFIGTVHPQLRVSQLRFLWTVADRPNSSQTELATELGITLAAVSRAVDVFGSSNRKDRSRDKSLGYIKVDRAKNDDRMLVVNLTQRGWDFLQQIEDSLWQSHDAPTGNSEQRSP